MGNTEWILCFSHKKKEEKKKKKKIVLQSFYNNAQTICVHTTHCMHASVCVCARGMRTRVCTRARMCVCLPTVAHEPSSLHSGHGVGMERVIIRPLLNPPSQFDMMNVQFPLSPHTKLITTSIHKACPTPAVHIIDQRTTSSDCLSFRTTLHPAKAWLN